MDQNSKKHALNRKLLACAAALYSRTRDPQRASNGEPGRHVSVSIVLLASPPRLKALSMPRSDAAVPPAQSNASRQEKAPGNANRIGFASTSENMLPLLVLAAGFVARLIAAWRFFLNPDEALHNLLASQSSLTLAYKAALTNAHPPLLILVLYYWRSLGQSELVLRMPSVLAGTATCWIAFRWLKLVTDRSTAFLGLLLLSFAPSLIGLSAEIRQYALLLFFMACCLWFSERANRENSLRFMILFSLSLYGALLTHYSSLIFAFTMGVYTLVRLYALGKRPRWFVAWLCGQVGALVLITYFLVTHVAQLKERGMPQSIAETWLRKSIFHAGENNVAVFVMWQTLRVFTYLFSHGVVGTLALLLFLAGVVVLLSRKLSWGQEGPTPRQLALLVGLPFVVNCGAALAGLYPYGNTRHNVFLAMFAVSGMCIGLAGWTPRRAWIKPSAVVAALALCNFYPSPPPLIRARNHSRRLMTAAVETLRQSAPPGSVLFSDYQSGLLLGYYACGHGVVQVFPPFQFFLRTDCGPYTAVTARPQEWKFYADEWSSQLAKLSETYGLPPGSKIWLFDAGWITDSTPALSAELLHSGCSEPRRFGENIFLCQLVVGADAGTGQPRPGPSAGSLRRAGGLVSP